MVEDKKQSWLVKHGLGGCACGICIKTAVFKNNLKQAAAKYLGIGNPRLPEGQRDIGKKFPVLDLGIHPEFDPNTWTFKIYGEVKNPMTWNWAGFQKLVKKDQISDFHCATSWSKMDIHWGGVPLNYLTGIVRPTQKAHYVIAECREGFKTNLSIEDALRDDVILAYELDGKPLPIKHGGPMRLVVPKLFAWKSAKFLEALRFTEKDEPGTWERLGYHNRGDPFKGERYAVPK